MGEAGKVMESQFGFSFRQIADKANDVIVVTTPAENGNTQIVYVNEAFTKLTEYSLDEVRGRDPRFLQGDDREQEGRKDLRRAIHEHDGTRVRLRNYSRSGRKYWLDISLVPLHDEQGNVTHFAAIERDVTAEVQREDRLREMALTDELTELPNRRAFDRELQREYSRRRRHGTRFSLLMFDIDHFKQVNDNYGHAAGDHVLESLGDICRQHFRVQDVIGRIGGEEFAVILPETGHEGALQVAERFRSLVEQSAFLFEGVSLQVTISIGVASTNGEEDAADLFKAADDALYEAKETGRNRVASVEESES